MRHVALVSFALSLLVGCDCGEPPPTRCTRSADCEAPLVCVDSRCIADPGPRADASIDGETPDAALPDDACVACGSACCGVNERCTSAMQCVVDLGPCMDDGDCLNDSYCLDDRCAPYGSLPRGETNTMCRRPVLPGRFAPEIQCHWAGPAMGDPAAAFVQVFSTPVVVDFGIDRGPDDPIRPSIVFIASDAFSYTDHGVVRVIDGRTCADQAVFADAADRVASASTPVVGNLDGPDTIATPDNPSPQTPEIVAKRAGGGLVAFGWNGTAWVRRWVSLLPSGAADPTAPSIAALSMADLDDDGTPEVISGALVYSSSGELIDSTQGLSNFLSTYGSPTVVADLDDDGDAELTNGQYVFDWNVAMRRWDRRDTPGVLGLVAVADFGDFPEAAGDRAGGPEVVIVADNQVQVRSVGGDVVFGPIDFPPTSESSAHGGSPTVGDFDGDGRPEIASGGSDWVTVFDLDCTASTDTPGCVRVESGIAPTVGILWAQRVQEGSAGINSSAVFDFEGDERMELVYGDECYVRVMDGPAGRVLWSAPRASGTWIEGPIVADVDGDFNAEVIVGSNRFHGACSALDPLHGGLTCDVDDDCPMSTGCVAGLCRCTASSDCGDPRSYACAPPIDGSTAMGEVCRASFTEEIVGVRVYEDASDRWVSSRRIWNQHGYFVTNVDEDGRIPRTSEMRNNWELAALNDFRRNVQGDLVPLAGPDLTIGRGACAASTAVLTAEVCNRGAEPVDSGMIASFFDGDPRTGGMPICEHATTDWLEPGECEPVMCSWPEPVPSGAREVWLWVDYSDTNVECVEDNNVARIDCMLE
ncbi:MAG: VCBS repeat-containing protein [Deltaproteobacteria bacterium]|nr:VCBS repeat-containing protein [Deltaproteobacteria bacterium]